MLSTDPGDSLTDSVIECALATRVGRRRARCLFGERTSTSRELSGADGVRPANGYSHRRGNGARGPLVFCETSTALVRADG